MEVTNAKKGSDQYLIEYCDYVIAYLVREKRDIIKAYNYFNGVRDHYQYENLEKNFGVGNPTSVGFTPLTRKHVEAIVGEYLTTKPKPKISCRDLKTLTAINREKQLLIAQELKLYISRYLNNAVYNAIMNNGKQQSQGGGQLVLDELVDRELARIKDSVNRNFISNFEIAAQDIITYTRLSREIDFYNKLEQLLLDLLIAGQAYYKVVATHEATNFKVEYCDPLNTWVDKDPKQRYMKHAYKSVVRRWMSAAEIEIKYGDWLTEDLIKQIHKWKNYYEDTRDYVVISGQCGRSGQGIVQGGVHPLDPDEIYYNWNLIPVYEVEWIDSGKREGKYVGYCYHATRIGQDIYILDADNDIMMPRNADEPSIPRLSVNGIWYTNGHGGPHSLMLATADLLDLSDLVRYQMTNYMANAGTRGAIVDVATLPEKLGSDLAERLKKYLAYRKNGLAIIDSSQEGGGNSPNQFYGGFDDSLNNSAIQGYVQYLQAIEDTVSSITGVFRERLGGIELRDAVANVEVGMQQSYIITKRYYQAMDTLVKEMLLDCIDMAKVVWSTGFIGEIIIGDLKKIFEIFPEYYTTTSFGIDFKDSAEAIKELETVKLLATSYMQSNMMDPEILFEISTSESLTEMKDLAMKSIRLKKEENNQLQQLQLQLQLLQDQNKQLQKQVEDSTKKLAQFNSQKLNMEREEANLKMQIEMEKIESNEKIRNRELDLIELRNKLEGLLLLDNNPRNDAVRNDKY